MKRQKNIEAETLKQHRLTMGFSQQEVAVLVGIQIRQYQRLEYGERSMSSASMRLGLAVCAVLKIDPFQLIFGDGENDFSDMW
jgi:transcriptional regulator with XRE-family HTH domain